MNCRVMSSRERFATANIHHIYIDWLGTLASQYQWSSTINLRTIRSYCFPAPCQVGWTLCSLSSDTCQTCVHGLSTAVHGLSRRLGQMLLLCKPI